MSGTRHTFKGGVDVPGFKELTKDIPLERAKEPSVVYIALRQHIGAPSEPIVKVGDSVKVGQKISQAGGFVSANMHSSVSGVVKSITKRDTPGGQGIMTIEIESDGRGEVDESLEKYPNLDQISKEEILKRIEEAGITGLGGASFPTHVKLMPPEDKKVDTFLLNGAECEPYLTADHRVLLEDPETVVFGTRAILKALGIKKGIIAIEDNKLDAIEAIKGVLKDSGDIEVAVLKAKYPQGDEKRIISAVLNREVPSGGLPADVGCVVNNVGTAKAIAEAIRDGKPLIERVVTITGNAIGQPKNLIAKIGTPFSELISQAGGFKVEPGKVIMGGPMMGAAQYTIDVPMIKGTSGILALTREEADLGESTACIKCAKCLTVCPVHLQPVYISRNALNGRMEEADKLNALDCIECGACSYICPSKRPLKESIKLAKQEILASKRR